MSKLAKLLRNRQQDGAPQQAAKRQKAAHTSKDAPRALKAASASLPAVQLHPEVASSDGEDDGLQPLIGDQSAYDALMHLFSSGNGHAAAALRQRQHEQAGDSNDVEESAKVGGTSWRTACQGMHLHGMLEDP